MANRRFEQFLYSLIKKKTELDGLISLSAAGAVLSADIPGVASVVKSATGKYTITLSDKYSKCYGVHTQITETSQDLIAIPDAVDVSSAKTVVVKTKTAGTDTDPSATCKIYVKIVLKNSAVP